VPTMIVIAHLAPRALLAQNARCLVNCYAVAAFMPSDVLSRSVYWVLAVAASAWPRSLLAVEDPLLSKKRAKSGWRRERKMIWAPLSEVVSFAVLCLGVRQECIYPVWGSAIQRTSTNLKT